MPFVVRLWGLLGKYLAFCYFYLSYLSECPILFSLFVFSHWVMGMANIPIPDAAISSPKVVIFNY